MDYKNAIFVVIDVGGDKPHYWGYYQNMHFKFIIKITFISDKLN